ncbi:hypothetical protein SDC9_58951 [bioreactor metagenome]|uniref:HTH cro/C1-type domain-containing protein n=1 Tax=bioreactor metagenome TaxID=1076179 RepID=A0A644X9K9_9ZZZZ
MKKEFSLNEKLKEFRESLKLSQTEFANAIGVSQGIISRVESGERNVGLKILRKIENAFPEYNHNSPFFADSWTPVDKFDLAKYAAEHIDILVVLDYREYDRPRRIEKASVHYTSEQRAYGGPNSLTGSGFLTGYYFSIPSIVAPGIVTHCRPLPKLPKE